MRKKLLIILLTIPFALLFINLFFPHFSENFHTRNFEHGFDQTYAIEVSGLDYSKLDTILGQPFHYLGQGKQMTAFETEDGRYVLKVFNPMRPYKKKWYKEWKLWKRYSSIKWIGRERFGKKQRLKKLFKRHKIAYQSLRDETGLVFVHLAPSERISHLAHVQDRHGIKHILELHHTPFVLQEKATLVPQYLQILGNSEEVKLAIKELEKLLCKRVSLGITDRIQTMDNNYGFVGSKPIQIDVGRIRVDPQIASNPEEERQRILTNFQNWISKLYPELF